MFHSCCTCLLRSSSTFRFQAFVPFQASLSATLLPRHIPCLQTQWSMMFECSAISFRDARHSWTKFDVVNTSVRDFIVIVTITISSLYILWYCNNFTALLMADISAYNILQSSSLIHPCKLGINLQKDQSQIRSLFDHWLSM